mgnify:CR=1 FL=1
MERILDRNTLVMVNARSGNDQEYEDGNDWPPLPEEHRTVENVAFVEMFRSGRICTINITEQMSEAIRETNRDIIEAALAPHGLDMNDLRNFDRDQVQRRETTREDDEETTSITYRENDEEVNEEEMHQEELRIFRLESSEEEPKSESCPVPVWKCCSKPWQKSNKSRSSRSQPKKSSRLDCATKALCNARQYRCSVVCWGSLGVIWP